MSAVDITAWGTVAGAAFLGLGAVAAWLEIRRGAQARETSLLLDHAFRWTEPQMVESLNASRVETPNSLRSLIEKKTLNDAERARWLTLQYAPNLLETVGYLEKNRSAINVRDVEGLWGSEIIFLWKLWEPTVREVLRPTSDTALLNFEELSKKVIRYRERRLAREQIGRLLRAVLPWLPRQ